MGTTAAALLSIARLITEVRYGIATGGSTTTLVDSSCTDPDDYFNKGLIWFLSGNNSGKTASITDFQNSTGTFVFATQTGACASANQYAAMPAYLTRDQLLASLNAALQDIGETMQVDETLDGVTDQLTYALPSGVSDVRRVQLIVDDDPETNYHWREVNGSLYFDSGKGPESGDTIRVFYVGSHAAVTLDADTISDSINPIRLAWTGAYYALIRRIGSMKSDDDGAKEMLSVAQAKVVEMSRTKATRLMAKDVRISGF